MNFKLHDYRPVQGSQPVKDSKQASEDLKTVVITGLSHSPKQLHPKFFYDESGSQLFDQICEQPEYYIPRVERKIFATYVDEIIASMGTDCTIIEPGAGSTKKIRYLLEHMQSNMPAMYVPMDISAEHLRSSAQRLSEDYPAVSIHAVCVDHTQHFNLPSEIPDHNRVFFYPGSSLGNFKPAEAIDFLQNLRNMAGDNGSFLIGIDTKKSVDVLNSAYNDKAGITAAFNLNLLTRINHELDADINVDSFSHHAFYNEELGRIEMHLVSKKKQTVQIMGNSFHFEGGESIHTENSYKYAVDEFQSLAWEAGWENDKVWLDDDEYFGVYFLRAR